MVKVSVDDKLGNFPHIQKIAEGIAIFEITRLTENVIYPSFLGHYSGLDNHPKARECGLSKFHIALTIDEMNSKKWHNRNPQNRTCNNFVVFVRHWLYTDYIRVLDIISPEAHERIDGLIPKLVDKAEHFFDKSKEELDKEINYSPNEEIKGKFLK
ncbi:Uncharacterised protein [Haemophilus parahaemolyticus]|uniref:Uncharacterized protein n=1 Tax=Haemophilus parahaemolyticus TaxID=735 RepID=A0A377I1Z0_HAEPH|nr:type II toxin-antitoxin system YafO family toxin [Haemophilus parahaemolyticus]STO64455.1 Uncharacterised protein [Haemophilus parahaemolyticus]